MLDKGPEVQVFLSFLRRKVDELEREQASPGQAESLVGPTGQADVLRGPRVDADGLDADVQCQEMERLLERLSPPDARA